MTDDQHYVPSHSDDALVLMGVETQVRQRAQAVRLMVFDVDGVLTDGSLYYGEKGEALKRFHAHDGYGLRLLAGLGITVAFISGRESVIFARRAAELGLGEVAQGVRNKGEALREMTQRLGIGLDQVGFMGDDMLDLSAMKLARFAATVPHAPVYVAGAAHWVSTRPGGNGAVRECCDLLLAAQGKLGKFLDRQGILTPGALQ